MAGATTDPIVLVVSREKDFFHPLIEQVEFLLALPCERTETYQAAMPLKATLALVVSTEAIAEDCVLPIIQVKQPPVVLRALLREIVDLRQKQLAADISFGNGYTLRPRSKTLEYAPSDKTVALTDKETHLLQHLYEAAGSVVSKEQLLKEVWGVEAALETHTLETHIYRLRAKLRELSDDEGIIEGVEGGYKLVAI